MRRRLDQELVRRSLASTRSEAREAILEGKVMVAGRIAEKPATLVAPGEPVELNASPRRWVSRGGEKLEPALDRFGVDVEGIEALDAGSSTGGFTDVLLARGAARVLAVDVGYGQLDWRLRNDPRVTVMERTNVRDLDQEALPFRPALVVADLSFISLRTVVPNLVRLAHPGASFLLLVKPQFEAGREHVQRGGVVTDPAAWRAAVLAVAEACASSGVGVTGVMPSPVRGPAGNVEFLLHGRAGEAPADLDLDQLIREVPD